MLLEEIGSPGLFVCAVGRGFVCCLVSCVVGGVSEGLCLSLSLMLFEETAGLSLLFPM